MQCGITYKFLTNKFEILGRTVTRHVSWFIVIPVFISLLLATGIQRIVTEASIVKFYAPYGSVALKTRDYLKSEYPLSNSPDFDPTRIASGARYASLIITAKDGHSVLRKHIFNEITNLHSMVYNDLNITVEDEVIGYEDICAKQKNRCYENEILLLKNKIEDIERGYSSLSYPLDESFRKKDFSTLALGGVTLNERGSVVSAQALRLIYFLDSNSNRKELLAKSWESKFLSEVAARKFVNVTVKRHASISLEDPIALVYSIALTCIPYTFILVIGFTVSTCLTPDCLRSKPWTGIMSAIATAMSMASGFGLVIYIGYKVDILATIVPFLILGVGMDDTFVMLSAWKKTNPKKSVEERMAETYSETGVSITITSATNIVSFAFGAIFAYFQSAQHFCIYMTICLAFDYLYQITFVGAMLALCGMAEERRLHSLTFIPLAKKVSSGPVSFLYTIFCYPAEEDGAALRQKTSWRILLEFWENLASILTKKISKAVVLFIFVVYLSTAMWSFTKVTFRCTFSPSTIYNTYQHSYALAHEENYYNYQQSIQFIINTTLNYADPKVQEKVLQMTERFESEPLFSGPLLTQSWLRSYRTFLNDRRFAPFVINYNMTDKDTFYYILRKVFFRHPITRRFEKDVVFNNNKTEIISSRFILQTNVTRNESDFYYQVRDFKKVFEKEEYPVLMYNPFFYYFDGLDVIFIMTVQTVCLITVLVTLVSAVLLPSVICIFCVGFSIVSVVTGVLGYMFLWGVSLEITSVVVLIVTCGFSVDYAAHVSCAYVSCKQKDPNERLRKAVIMTGMPIFQGSVSTICVVVFFSNPPSYEFGITLKIIILVSVIAALHGIIFIPVIMSLLDSTSSRLRILAKTLNDRQLDIPSSTKSNLSPNGFYGMGNTCPSLGDCNGIYKIKASRY